MAAPDFNWNTITATQTDADSPVDETLMESIRQNLIHLEQWMGDSYTAAKDHDHDNVNSANVALGNRTVAAIKIVANALTAAEIAGNAIAQSELSTAHGTPTLRALAALERWTPTDGIRTITYDHANLYFQIRVSGTWEGASSAPTGTVFFPGSNIAVFNIDAGSARTLYYATLS